MRAEIVSTRRKGVSTEKRRHSTVQRMYHSSVPLADAVLTQRQLTTDWIYVGSPARFDSLVQLNKLMTEPKGPIGTVAFGARSRSVCSRRARRQRHRPWAGGASGTLQRGAGRGSGGAARDVGRHGRRRREVSQARGGRCARAQRGRYSGAATRRRPRALESHGARRCAPWNVGLGAPTRALSLVGAYY